MIAIDVISPKSHHSSETMSQMHIFKFWTNVNLLCFWSYMILKYICKFRPVFLTIFQISQKFNKHFTLNFLNHLLQLDFIFGLLYNSVIVPWVYIFKYFVKLSNSKWLSKTYTVKILCLSLPWNQADAKNSF